jgi:hypothetical protein
MAESILVGMETKFSTSLWGIDAGMESYPDTFPTRARISTVANARWKAIELSNQIGSE